MYFLTFDLAAVLLVLVFISLVVGIMSLDFMHVQKKDIDIIVITRELIESLLFWPLIAFGLIIHRKSYKQGFWCFMGWLVATGLLTIFFYLKKEISPIKTITIVFLASFLWFYLDIGIKYMTRKDKNVLRHR